MSLILSVFALTVATLTIVLAARRLLVVVSELVYARYVAVGGLVAFSVTHEGDACYRMRFEAGGPAVFHNVAVALCGVSDVDAPAPRDNMRACDAPLEWTFTLPDAGAAAHAWVMVSWVRPYLEGIDSEAIAQPLQGDQLYEWRWFSDPNRFVRTGLRAFAHRFPRLSGGRMRELSLYGRWRRTTSSSPSDLLGPADVVPPGIRPAH